MVVVVFMGFVVFVVVVAVFMPGPGRPNAPHAFCLCVPQLDLESHGPGAKNCA